MKFKTLTWLFAISISIHNFEEAVYLPNWSKSAGYWHHPVEASEFYFAVIILTLFAYVSVFLAVRGGLKNLGAYLVSGYALSMLLNVFFPHLLATIVMWQYAPGTGTGLLLNLPVTTMLIYKALKEGYIEKAKFFVIGPLIVLGILGSIPVLFSIFSQFTN